jgi:hypothetical protein
VKCRRIRERLLGVEELELTTGHDSTAIRASESRSSAKARGVADV